MSLVKKSIISLMFIGAIVSSCGSDTMEDTAEETISAEQENKEVLAEEDAEEVQDVQESIDDKGNLVDKDGNIIMTAEEASAHPPEGREAISQTDRAFVNEITKLNNKYIATIQLGIEKGSRLEINDIANGLLGEHERLKDMFSTFTGETPGHLEKALAKPATINGEKGQAWDNAWAAELKKMNVALIAAIRSGKGKVENEHLKHITMEFPEHLEHEQQMLGDVKKMFQE